VVKSDFDLQWLALGNLPGSLRYDLFVEYYDLQLGTAEPVPDEIIDVYYLDPAFLLQLSDFIYSHPSGCLGAGYLTAFPDEPFNICEDDI